MKICLITKLNYDGTVEGSIPYIQDLKYWFESGYRFITHVTENVITLCKQDIGKELGCGAYLTQLRRTQIGDFNIQQAQTMDTIIASSRRNH